MSDIFSGKHQSFWQEVVPGPIYPSLAESRPTVEFDVAILGGGLAGLWSAYLLKKQGKKVAVLEAEYVGFGVSGHTTAHITSEHNYIYDYLIKTFGKEKAQLYADANQAAIHKIAEVIQKETIACDFKRLSQFLFTEKTADEGRLRQEYEAAKSLGLPVSYEHETDLPFKIQGAIEYHDQAQFHPGKFLKHLATLVEGDGSRIFEQSRAFNVKEGEPCVVMTEHGELRAKDVIVTTHFPILDRGGYFARMEVNRSYVLGVFIKEKITQMYDDSYDPFHYIRTVPTPKGVMVLVGGEDHGTGQDSDTVGRFKKLEEFARSHFTVKEIAYYWSSQDNYPHDRVPFIGRYTPTSNHLFVATGFYGYGMTHSCVSGMLLTDMILDKKNSWEKIFTPQRFIAQEEGPSLLQTGAKVTQRYLQKAVNMVSSSPDRVDLSSLKKGSGKVVELAKKKIAVFKDDAGELHSVSASCQHQGCDLAFNEAEQSWDCPCHGSRFDYEGKVLHGPTVKPLPPARLK